MRKHAISWFLVGVMLALPARADRREIVEVNHYPWSTVARVGFGHGWCSAVIIGPQLAATAAHCLWNKVTGRAMKAAALSVVVGWDRGQFVDGSGVTQAVTSEHWKPEEMPHYGPEQAGRDWALLRLDKPLGDEVGWVALSDRIAVNQTVSAVGYGEDRKHVATAHLDCHITGRLPSGVWTHNCDAVHGDSGGPVFSGEGDDIRVVALHVARFDFTSGATAGGAVGVGEFMEMAKRMGAALSSHVPIATPSHTSKIDTKP